MTSQSKHLGVPYLVMIEQPFKKYHFRYTTESKSTFHGSLLGVRSEGAYKSYPSVQLQGYNGEDAVIRVSLVHHLENIPSAHRLASKKNTDILYDLITKPVSREDKFHAKFKNLGIIHTKKKNVRKELTNTITKIMECNGSASQSDRTLEMRVSEGIKKFDPNRVRLCFEAFIKSNNNNLVQLCDPIFSDIIMNSKSIGCNNLKITKLQQASGYATGHEELLMLVEKVNHTDITVRFSDEDEESDDFWEEYVTIPKENVHHQVAIVCNIPPYKIKEFDGMIRIKIELERPSDNERSPPVKFFYKGAGHRSKRQRKN